MKVFIRPDHGQISLGALVITWGNPLVDLDLPGFFTVSAGSWALEMGDIDQSRPGIYIVKYIEGDPYTVRTIWQQ